MFRISTRTHGLLDYFVGPALAALPQVLDCNRTTARVLKAAGIGAAAYSMLTDYERGVVKTLPMETHLALDAISGASLIGAAMLLRDETPQNRFLLAGIGAFEIAVASMTSTEAYADGEPASPAERIAERIGQYV